jgi:hypothetical protein
MKGELSMFASKSLFEHFLRGLLGAGLVALGIASSSAHPWVAFVTFPAALVALRGCPTCWTVGLIQVLAAKLLGREVSASCVDGSCTKGSRTPESGPPEGGPPQVPALPRAATGRT